MVAACRALETARADGLVRDPFAERLAGPRGDAILQGITGWQLMCFGIGVRTRFLDDLVIETIAREGIEVVLSVGSGLDTRPWRLELPPYLRWIEADFPEMLSYKTRAMAAEEPKCRLERVAADVTAEAQRAALFRAAAGSLHVVTSARSPSHAGRKRIFRDAGVGIGISAVSNRLCSPR
jgi:methyltransferase (TIGR00027 family)